MLMRHGPHRMATETDIRPLTSPRIFLVGMAAFLIIVAFVVLILWRQIETAFHANPGLNGFIIGVLLLGAIFTFRQVIRLFREIGWVNSLSGARPWRSNRGRACSGRWRRCSMPASVRAASRRPPPARSSIR